jgi:hypothetical protein
MIHTVTINNPSLTTLYVLFVYKCMRYHTRTVRLNREVEVAVMLVFDLRTVVIGRYIVPCRMEKQIRISLQSCG